GLLDRVDRIAITLYGSLALTGLGHGTDNAVLLGLSGEHPETIDPEHGRRIVDHIVSSKCIKLGGAKQIGFLRNRDLHFQPDNLALHPNGMRFAAFAADDALLREEAVYSIGC